MIGRGWPAPFALVRTTDPSAVSGTGVVAAGIIWPDQRAAFRWTALRPPAGHQAIVQQVCLFDRASEILTVHGHQGATRIETRDPMSGCSDLGMSVFGIVGSYGLRRVVAYWGVAYDDGPALTWRNDPARPPRIEQWPGGWADAWTELRDGETAADEIRLSWVPSQASDLIDAHRTYALSGRTPRVVRRGETKKSPH